MTCTTIRQSVIDELEVSIIYVLCNPTTYKIRYVGKTNKDPRRRLTKHVSSARRKQDTYKKKWVAKLLGQHLLPSLFILEVVPRELANEREKYWIRRFLSSGHSLVKGTIGGDGVSLTQEGKRKTSLRFRGENSVTARLTERDVITMREMYRTKQYYICTIAEKYSMSYYAVWAALIGKSWKLLPNQ